MSAPMKIEKCKDKSQQTDVSMKNSPAYNKSPVRATDHCKPIPKIIDSWVFTPKNGHTSTYKAYRRNFKKYYGPNHEWNFQSIKHPPWNIKKTDLPYYIRDFFLLKAKILNTENAYAQSKREHEVRTHKLMSKMKNSTQNYKQKADEIAAKARQNSDVKTLQPHEVYDELMRRKHRLCELTSGSANMQKIAKRSRTRNEKV